MGRHRIRNNRWSKVKALHLPQGPFPAGSRPWVAPPGHPRAFLPPPCQPLPGFSPWLGLPAPLHAPIPEFGKSTQHRQEGEGRERQQRVCQAEAEDNTREKKRQRQHRLADEQLNSPAAVNTPAKTSPPPSSRKNMVDNADEQAEANCKAGEAATQLKVEQEANEQAIRAQRRVQKVQKSIEDETVSQENELDEELQASQARCSALEEQFKQGKIKKEEKSRKRAAEREFKERKARLAALRAEVEASKEKERQLQLQLESLNNDDSSDDQDSQKIIPQDPTPSNTQIFSRLGSTQSMESSRSSRSTTTKLPGTISPPATTAPQAFLTYNESETPFFKTLNQPIKLESNGGQLSSFLASPTATEVSINSIHLLGQQKSVSKTLSQPPSRPAFSKPLSSTATGGHRPVFAWSEEGQYSIVDYTENNHGGYGCEPFGGETGGEQSIYAQPHQGYGMSTQQIPYYQHSSSTANVRGFTQQQLVPSRDGNAGETLASYCCSGSAQPSGNGQQYSRTGVGGYSNLHDALARSASGFLGAVGKNDDPCGGYCNSLQVSGGPRPALDQPGGGPESVVNNMQGQTGLPPRS